MALNLSKQQLRELHDRWLEKSDFIKRATIDTIRKETAAEQENRVKFLMKPENYGAMFNYYFGKDTFIPMADCDCAWYHNAIYKDLFYNEFLTIFNLIFRGGAKSTHANMGYPFALKQCEKAKFFLVVGASEPRAAMLLQDLQVQFAFNKRIINDFGSQKVYGNWADGTFETTDRSTFMALGIDQPFRGLRQNGVRLEYVSIDDVEDKKRALNTRLTDEYVSKVTADIQGAFSTRSERTIVNNNYFVKNGFIERLAKKKGHNLAKIDTKKSSIITSKYSKIYLINLTSRYLDQVKADNTETWEPSWIERFSKTDCLRKIEQYKHDMETLSGEFYNTPINVGKRIKEGMIKLVKPLTLSEYDAIVENWDLAYSDAACYKAKATLGIKGNRMTVLDVFCRQTDIDIAIQYHYTKAKQVLKENPALLSFYDASVAQEAVYEKEWNRGAIKYKSYQIPLPQRSTVDKYMKIDITLVAALLTGILDFSQDLEKNPDWEEAKRQMLDFEKGTKSAVDFPDALTDAILMSADCLSDYDPDDEEQKNSLMNNPVIEKKQRGVY
jgi:hypothetical protein